MFRAGRHCVRVRTQNHTRNYSWNPLSWIRSGVTPTNVTPPPVIESTTSIENISQIPQPTILEPLQPTIIEPSVVDPAPFVDLTIPLAPGEPVASNIFEVVNPEPELITAMIDGWDYFSTLASLNPITYMTLGLDYILPFGDASPLIAIFAVCVPIRMAASYANLISTAEIVQAMTMSRLRQAIFKSTQGMAENSPSSVNVLHQGDRGQSTRMNVVPLQRVVEFNKYMKGFGVDLLDEGMERKYYKKMMISKAPTMASFFLISLFLREARLLPLECLQTPFLYFDNLSSFSSSTLPISAACFGTAFLLSNVYQTAAMAKFTTQKIPIQTQATQYAKSFFLPAGVMYGLMWAINMPNILQVIFIVTTFGNQALNAMVKTNVSMKNFFNYKTQQELIIDIQEYVRKNDKYKELLDQRLQNQTLLQSHYGWNSTSSSDDSQMSLTEKFQAKRSKFQENSLEMGKIKAAYEAVSGKDFESAGREYLQHIYPYYIHEEKEDQSASEGVYDKMIENERNLWMEEVNRNKSSYEELDFELFDEGIGNTPSVRPPTVDDDDELTSFYKPTTPSIETRPWWERSQMA